MLIEGHGRFNIPTGIKIAKELEQFKPMFFEEPTPPDDLNALKAVRDKSPVAISAGERLYTRWDYKRMFELMAADYIQPDISHAGVPMFRRYMCIRPDASLLWKDGNEDCQRSLFAPFPHAVYRWHVLPGFACGEDYRKA